VSVSEDDTVFLDGDGTRTLKKEQQVHAVPI
jgi:hypothetical protein